MLCVNVHEEETLCFLTSTQEYCLCIGKAHVALQYHSSEEEIHNCRKS